MAKFILNDETHVPFKWLLALAGSFGAGLGFAIYVGVVFQRVESRLEAQEKAETEISQRVDATELDLKERLAVRSEIFQRLSNIDGKLDILLRRLPP